MHTDSNSWQHPQSRSYGSCRVSGCCCETFIVRSPGRLLLFQCLPDAQQPMICPLNETWSTSLLLYRDRLGTDLESSLEKCLICVYSSENNFTAVGVMVTMVGLWMSLFGVPPVSFLRVVMSKFLFCTWTVRAVYLANGRTLEKHPGGFFSTIPTKAPKHAGIGVSWLLNWVADIEKVHTKYVAIGKTQWASFVCSIPSHKSPSIPWIQNWPRFWTFREWRIMMLHSYGTFNKFSHIGYWHKKNSWELIMSAIARISESVQPLLLETWFVTSSSSVWSLLEMQNLRAHSRSVESQCGVYSVGSPDNFCAH